jgi:hypothetical protein
MFNTSGNICHESARECVRLARASDDPDLRHELFEMARHWMALALDEQDQTPALDGTDAYHP